MPIKSSATAMLGVTMAILLAAPAAAHAGKQHHRYFKFDKYSHCRSYHFPWNGGHDRVFIVRCLDPGFHQQGNGHDRATYHNRDNGHDRGNGPTR